jgi:hypothetical protein
MDIRFHPLGRHHDMTPTLVQTTLPTPLGDMRLAASGAGLAGAWFTTGQRHLPAPERMAARQAARIALANGQVRFRLEGCK